MKSVPHLTVPGGKKKSWLKVCAESGSPPVISITFAVCHFQLQSSYVVGHFQLIHLIQIKKLIKKNSSQCKKYGSIWTHSRGTVYVTQDHKIHTSQVQVDPYFLYRKKYKSILNLSVGIVWSKITFIYLFIDVYKPKKQQQNKSFCV